MKQCKVNQVPVIQVINTKAMQPGYILYGQETVYRTYHLSTPPFPLTLVVPSRADSFPASLGDLRGNTGGSDTKDFSVSKQRATGIWGRGSTPGGGTGRRKRRLRHQTQPLGSRTS